MPALKKGSSRLSGKKDVIETDDYDEMAENEIGKLDTSAFQMLKKKLQLLDQVLFCKVIS